MKTALLTLAACAFSLFCFAQKRTQHHRFSIIGIANGYADDTFIYLSDLSDGTYKDVDSAIIQKEKFVLKGILKEPIAKFAVHTKDFSDRLIIWIDKTQTYFAGEKGKFKNAQVKGSTTQLEKNRLDSIIARSENKKLDYISFIQNHPQSIVSADLLSIYSSVWNKDTVAALYKQLSKSVKNTRYGKNVSDFLSLNKSPKVGDLFIDFAQQNVHGKMVKLSDFKGKVVLVEFWGSWCVPCREGHAELIKTYAEFKNKGFEILGVAADVDKTLLMDAVQKDGLPWQNVSDLKGDRNKAALIYGVSYYPSNFLIDKQGVIVAKDLRGEKLRQKLSEVLGE